MFKGLFDQTEPVFRNFVFCPYGKLPKFYVILKIKTRPEDMTYICSYIKFD